MDENQKAANPVQPPAAQPSETTPPTTMAANNRVIQPSSDFVKELQAQDPEATIEPAPTPMTPPQPIPPAPTIPPDGRMQAGMSASQMGWNQPKTNDFHSKKLLVKGLIGVLLAGGVFAVLVLTNVIALSKFKTIDYVNADGTHYTLTFYTKHSLKTHDRAVTLVSKVSENDAYPITLSIASNSNESSYTYAKNCSSSGLKKVFDVQNTNLNQKISVCNVSLGQGTPNGVYIAGIRHNNQTSVVTISQDLSGVDLSNSSGAKESLPKFGLDPYKDDVKTIVASINIE